MKCGRASPQRRAAIVLTTSRAPTPATSRSASCMTPARRGQTERGGAELRDDRFWRGLSARARSARRGQPLHGGLPGLRPTALRGRPNRSFRIRRRGTLDLRVIVNHFKSRRGDETENLPQRLAQADHLAQLLEGPHRIALGDLNDTPDSATLQRLVAFADLYETHTLRADAYTYIYNGLAESPDYVIVSTDLLRYIKAAGPVHINADFPDLLVPDRSSRRSSDHDPLLVRFTFDPRAIWPDWRRFYEGRWRQNQSLRLK